MKASALPHLLTPPQAVAPPSPARPAGDAGTVFKNILSEVNAQQLNADSKVGRSLLGQNDLHEAMLALEKANLSLRFLVQVRNKLVQAYEELSRMPL